MKALRIILILLFGCQLSYGQIDSRTIEYDGNLITINKINIDTIEAVDPETGETVMKVMKEERFSLLNDEPIYQGNEVQQPIGHSSLPVLKSFLEKLLEDELKSVRHTFTSLELIINEKGQIAYYDTHFSKPSNNLEDNSGIVNASMFMKLQDVRFRPARKDGMAVPYYIKID